MKHVNKAVLEIDEADDQVIMTTFQAELKILILSFCWERHPQPP